MNTQKPIKYLSWRAEASLDNPNLVYTTNQTLHFNKEDAILAAKREDGNTKEQGVFAWGEALVEFEDGQTLEIYSGQFIVKK